MKGNIGRIKNASIVTTLVIALMLSTVMPAISTDYEPQAGTGIGTLIPSASDVEVGDDFYVMLYVDSGADSTTGFTIRQLLFNESSVGLANVIPTIAGLNCTFQPSWVGAMNDDGTLDNSTGNFTYIMGVNLGGVIGNNTAVRINFTALKCGVLDITIPTTIWSGQPGFVIDLMDTVQWYNTTVTIHPATPAAIGATMWNHTAINLTFTPGSGGPNTTICASNVSFDDISGPDDGVIYNGSDNFYNHTGLDPCLKYWYKAWTWNETESLHSVTYRQASATTQCYTNFSFSGEVPTDASTTANGVYNIPVNVTVTNSAGHTYEIWINTSVGNLLHHGPGLTNGSQGVTMSGLNHNTLYYWNVTVSDGNGDVSSANYTFTTGTGGGSSPNPPDNPDPANHAPSIPINIGLFQVDVSDPDADPINTTFKWANGTVIGWDDNTASGGTASISPTLTLSYGTVYQWYAVASDGILSTQGPTWDFTTDIISVVTTKEWTVHANNSVQVWLNVSNNGQTNLTDILITETYDTNLVFNGSSPTNNSGHDDQWTIPYLNMTGYAGNWYNITIWLNLTGTLTNGDTLGNTIRSTILGVDNITTMGDSDKLDIGLTITKEANETYWDLDNTYTYWLNVTNTGDFTLHNVWINETYDSDCTYMSNSSVPAADDETHGNNSWMWNTLTPGSTIVVTIVVNATGANGSLVSNTVDIETMEGPSGQATLDNYIGVSTTQLRITYNTPLGSLLSGSYTALLLILILGIVLAAVAIMYVIVKLRKQGE